jgi:hypothetical protein
MYIRYQEVQPYDIGCKVNYQATISLITSEKPQYFYDILDQLRIVFITQYLTGEITASTFC